MKLTDLKRPELSASKITEIALQLLNARNITAWRQNNLTVQHRKNIVTPGVGDIIGFHRFTGIHCEIEVKKLGDKLSDDQIIHLTKVHQAGALALIATEINGRVELISFVNYVKQKI